MLPKILEWFGVLTAIAYSMLVASNTGNEVLGFAVALHLRHRHRRLGVSL
jgi:hypothetical protein